ncbi:MAG TPA: serine hydrolase domain-containing protein [Rhizomicrobium sp.]|jgi:CubicO group peptidase (beta-lactamase class C family)|nr:serine hydrolase domain-containing protein [Rhizomicrobium sp.]
MPMRYAAIAILTLAVLATPARAAPPDLHDGWRIAAPEAVGLDPAPLAGLAAAIARGDDPKTTSVLVVRDGELVYEAYFGEGGPDLLNNTRSATKIFAALAVGTAIRDGAIPSQQAPAFAFLADLRPFRNDTADKQAITIADMLSMSSALDCDDSVDASPGNEDHMHPQPNWTRWAVDLPTLPNYARDAAGYGPWRYCTANAFLVGQIVQRATHTPVDKYIEANLLRPLGIVRQNWSRSPAGEIMTGGGLELRSRDLAKVAWMLSDGGRWQGRQIVPSAWAHAMLTIRRRSRPDQSYGYFVFAGTYKGACGPLPVWYMAGNGGSQVLMLPAQRTAIVVTRTNYNVPGTSLQTQDLLEKYVLAALPCAARPRR